MSVDAPEEVGFDVQGSWSTVDRLPEELTGSMATRWDDRVYVLGGYAGSAAGRATRHFMSYDVVTGKREDHADYPAPVAEGALVVYRDTLLAVGGNAGSEADLVVSALIHWYDPANDAWNVWSELPERRFRFVANVVGDRLYVLGGRNFDQPPGDSIVVLEGRTAHYGAPPNASYSEPITGGVLGDTIFVLTSLFDSRVLRFDGSTATWLQPFGNPVAGMATGGTVGGRLHVMGLGQEAEHRAWSPVLGRWLTTPPASDPVEGGAVVGVGSTLWLIGGHDRERTATNRVQVFTPGG